MPDFAVKTAFTAVDGVSSVFNRMGGSADKFGKKANSMFSQIASAAGMFGGIYLLAAGLKKVATSAMMIEDAQAAFTPLLGSVEKATQLVEMLNVAAAETPFQFEDLSKVAKQLLPVMNGDLNNVISTMKMLGDTAGGNAEKLDSITRGYTKAMLKGKVDMEALNMIAEAGVPIHTQLAESMGYGKDQMTQFFKKISSGTVSTDQLNKAFRKMTSEGGLFFNGMIIASKTTSGVMSTMSDNLTMVAAGIGTALLPTIKELAISISDTASDVLNFIKNNKDLISTIVSVLVPAIKYAIEAYVAWKVVTWAMMVPMIINNGLIWAAQIALWAMTAAEWAAQVASWALTAANWGNLAVSVLSTIAIWAIQVALWAEQAALWAAQIAMWAFTAAQWALNVAMDANPIGLVILAIAALVGVVVVAIKYWDEFGASMTITMGCFGPIISLVKTFYDNWQKIEDAFSNGGIIEGMREIGNTIYESIIYPLEQAWGWIQKLPGASDAKKFVSDKFDDVKNFFSSDSPNQAEVDGKYSANQTVNINNSAGVKSEVTSSNKNAKVNMNRLGEAY